MFKLICDIKKPDRGWSYSEEWFTVAEKRTAVEIAQERLNLPLLYRNVGVLDLTFAKGEVVSVEIHAKSLAKGGVVVDVVEVGRKTISLPALTFVDLSKLPRLSSKFAAVAKLPVAQAFEAKKAEARKAEAKKARVTKRERQFGDKAAV